eukprot:m.623129 g.623129  ORF g.623129 m.623129 type:complete len:930 (-) comp22544_c0_seq6:533-3322(-)
MDGNPDPSMSNFTDAFEDEDDDFDMPLAANAENKALHKAVKKMEREMLELDTDIDANSTRIKAMQDHLKNVNQEAKLLKGVTDARQSEIASEKNMAVLWEQERATLLKESGALEKKLKEDQEAQNNIQNEIFAAQSEIETLREQMNWDKNQLEEWLESARQQEEDANMLRKYEKADEARVKELTLQGEKLAVEVKRQRHLLENEVTNTREHELGLDKVAELFREAHEERVTLIGQWENTVKQMQLEDERIDSIAEEFQNLKQETRKYTLEANEQQEFLEQQKIATSEVDQACEKRERLLVRQEEAKSRAQEELARFETERDSLQNIITRTSVDAQNKAREVVAMKDTIATKTKRLEQLQSEVNAAQKNVDAKKMKNMSAEEQTRALESQLVEEERYVSEVQKLLEAASKTLAKEAQRTHELKGKEATVQSERNACAQTEKNLASQLRTAEKQAAGEAQLLYRQDFQSAVLERKLLHLEGTVTTEKTNPLEAENARLRTVLEGHEGTHRLLVTQLRKVEDDQRIAQKHRDKQAVEHQALVDKLADIKLYNTGAEKELMKVVEAKQNLMVDENLLKLEIRRLRKRLNHRADDVLSLEQRKLQLSVAMEERMHEINVHKELLVAQKLECSKQLSSITKELTERNVRIDQLRKKHEIVSFSMKSIGEDGEPQSEAFLIVKIAQEREEMQQKGDKLDALIRKREKELRMLDNTLQLMNGHNHKYKDSLKRVDGESSDLMHKEHLEGQLRTAVDKYKHKRRELRLQQEALAAARTEHTTVARALETARGDMAVLTEEVHALERELEDQQAKLRRATSQAEKVLTQYRKQHLGGEAPEGSGASGEGETVAEKAFRLRNMRESNAGVLEQIDRVVHELPDIRPQVSLLYDRLGITRALQPPRSAGSSRLSSAASSRSAASSKHSARSHTSTSRYRFT